MTPTATVPGLTAVGPVVILTGPAARAAAQALLIAVRSRRVNGLPPSAQYASIAAALVTAAGQWDTRVGAGADAVDMQQIPTMPIGTAARHLGLSKRQTRRLAPALGGRLIGGRWLLDAQAVAEHEQGVQANG